MARWHAEWSIAKRRVPSRATARTLVTSRAEPICREQPPDFPCTNPDWRAPDVDTCPGGTAATDAQWGDRAFERQYRDRMGLRWLVCTRARSIAAFDRGSA